MELISRARWVRHIAKRPVTVAGGSASVTDPGTWATYRQAKASKVGDGLGFVLGDGIGGYDLDHVLTDGGLHPDAEVFLASVPDTYIEVSPSGDGLHVLGFMPESPGRVFQYGGIKVEQYSTGRYFTMTGRRWKSSPLTLANFNVGASAPVFRG